MARRNRVDPWGDLHAVSSRGGFTGNRGCLVDEERLLVRHHAGSLWIICVTEFRDWRHPLDQPHRWTPLFFLDDAVALAAGHRPCGLCRRDAYQSYRDAVAAADRSVGRGLVGGAEATSADGRDPIATATGGRQGTRAVDLNRRLQAERLRRGRGLERAGDRRTWAAELPSLPTGTVVLHGEARTPHLVANDRLLAFGFDGWHSPVARPASATVEVLTPPTSVAALRDGFEPVLHPSATAG